MTSSIYWYISVRFGSDPLSVRTYFMYESLKYQHQRKTLSLSYFFRSEWTETWRAALTIRTRCQCWLTGRSHCPRPPSPTRTARLSAETATWPEVRSAMTGICVTGTAARCAAAQSTPFIAQVIANSYLSLFNKHCNIVYMYSCEPVHNCMVTDVPIYLWVPYVKKRFFFSNRTLPKWNVMILLTERTFQINVF